MCSRCACVPPVCSTSQGVRSSVRSFAVVFEVEKAFVLSKIKKIISRDCKKNYLVYLSAVGFFYVFRTVQKHGPFFLVLLPLRFFLNRFLNDRESLKKKSVGR